MDAGYSQHPHKLPQKGLNMKTYKIGYGVSVVDKYNRVLIEINSAKLEMSLQVSYLSKDVLEQQIDVVSNLTVPCLMEWDKSRRIEAWIAQQLQGVLYSVAFARVGYCGNVITFGPWDDTIQLNNGEDVVQISMESFEAVVDYACRNSESTANYCSLADFLFNLYKLCELDTSDFLVLKRGNTSVYSSSLLMPLK